MSNLTRSALAVAITATLFGMAGCGAGKQAAGGAGGPPPAASAAPAIDAQPTKEPVTAQPPVQAAGTAAILPEPKPPQPVTNADTKPAASAPAPAPAPAKPPAPAPAPTRTAPAATAKGSDATPLKFAELYSGASIEKGLQLSEKIQALNGRRVRMTGYMAPPLKPSLDFFVLTKQPMSICPFCSTDADWPDDIILVLVKDKAEAMVPTTPIQVTGVLEVGGKQDPQTGFYSVIRIYADSVKEVK